jgi:surfactin synthase thioesterase subunit
MAIRVVLMLDGDIKLADLMTRPTLRELAQVLDRGTGSSASLLVRYAGHDTPLASVVCLPYAGGSSASFQSLAQSVVGLGAALSVYGVDLPGHELVGQQGALLDVEAMAAQIAMEIRATVGTPVVLWGHCVGAAMALAVESELQKAGHEVVRVFIGGKLLPSMQDAEAGIAAMDRMSNADVLSWMVKETGHTELAELAAQHADRLVTLFRHDARTANRYLGGLAAGRPQRLPSLTVVFADDDPLTKGYETGYSRWQAVCDELRMTRLPDGGHYFCRTRANEVARIIVNELEKSNHTMPGGMSKE